MATKSSSEEPQLARCHVVVCWPDEKLGEVATALDRHKELESHTVGASEGVRELDRLVDSIESRPGSDLLLLLLIGPCDATRHTQLLHFLSERRARLSATFVCLLDSQLAESARERLALADAGVNMVSSSVAQSARCVEQVLSYLLTRRQAGSLLVCPECGLGRLREDDLWNHFPLYHINSPAKCVKCPICFESVPSPGQHIHESHGLAVRGAVALSANQNIERFYGYSFVVVQREKDNKFLVVQEFGQLGYWLPAGRVDPNESFQIAAIREVREEVGIDVKLKGILGISHGRYHEGGMRMEVVFFAIPANTHPEQLPKTTPDYESAGACWVTYEDLLSVKVRSNCVKHWVKHVLDGHTVYPLSFLM